MIHFVGYLRVSTDKQGERGMHAHRQAIENHLRSHQGEILEEFVEVESEKKNDRPALRAAMNHCQVSQATLVIAKLDRLSRDHIPGKRSLSSNLQRETGVEVNTDWLACVRKSIKRTTCHNLTIEVIDALA